jgi:hypothetical protein
MNVIRTNLDDETDRKLRGVSGDRDRHRPAGDGVLHRTKTLERIDERRPRDIIHS